MEFNVNDLKHYLERLRKSRGLTQKELAHSLGKHQSFIGKLETKSDTIRLVDLLLILNGLEADPIEFLRHYLATTNKLDLSPKMDLNQLNSFFKENGRVRMFREPLSNESQSEYGQLVANYVYRSTEKQLLHKLHGFIPDPSSTRFFIHKLECVDIERLPKDLVEGLEIVEEDYHGRIRLRYKPSVLHEERNDLYSDLKSFRVGRECLPPIKIETTDFYLVCRPEDISIFSEIEIGGVQIRAVVCNEFFPVVLKDGRFIKKQRRVEWRMFHTVNSFGVQPYEHKVPTSN